MRAGRACGGRLQGPPGTRCEVTGPGFSYAVPDADIASGMVTHNLGGVGVQLDCWAGGLGARATAS